jgi:hypothetical protein
MILIASWDQHAPSQSSIVIPRYSEKSLQHCACGCFVLHASFVIRFTDTCSGDASDYLSMTVWDDLDKAEHSPELTAEILSGVMECGK